MEEPNPELESFRQQWKAEVSAKAKAEGGNHPTSSAQSSRAPRRPPAAPRIAAERAPRAADEEDDHADPEPFRGLDAPHAGPERPESSKAGSAEPRSALEYYEKAVEKESQGSLGDSLDNYRKAFKLDHRVDLTYKNKHFPPSHKPLNPDSAPSQSTKTNTAHHSLDEPPPSIKQLITGFAGLSIEPAPPAIEGDPAPPCPLATLPSEILVHIFRDLAIVDVASFVRLAQVCKRMAYLVATEEQIWRRICEGNEVGFAAMHYQFQVEIHGGPLEDDTFLSPPSDSSDVATLPPTPPAPTGNLTLGLLDSLYSSSWRQMFRLRPRIRFNGCYISTNNYIRPGQVAPSQTTWSSPVHIVTYYRYLRFLRDGSAISLLTTAEPSEVVHHITPGLLATHQGGANAHLPSAVMRHALRGRWRLVPAAEHPEGVEGSLCVETEGAGPKYMYRQDLSLRSAGKAAKNNKLAWSAYWFYNRLTDDWAEFSRKNEKPMFWSRVRSYGNGA